MLPRERIGRPYPVIVILALLFGVTGFTAVLAEQSFEKLLGTLLGTSTPAAAVVLSVYFAGLSVGAWSYGTLRLTPRFSPFRMYASLEAGVGAWTLLLFVSFDRLIPLCVPLLQIGRDEFWLLQFLRFLVACSWILPPTLLMGATLPTVIDALVETDPERSPRMFSWMYAVNILGAVLATGLAPYVLLPLGGLDGALLVAGVLDLAVAAVAIWLARITGRSKILVTESSRESASEGPRHLLVWVAGLSGFLFFGLELLWTHLIGVVSGSSIYAFSTMLTAVLLGLFAGGAVASAIYPRRQYVPLIAPGLFLLMGAVAVGIQFRFWPTIPHQFAVRGAHIDDFIHGELLRAALALAMLLPITTILGAVFPLLFRLKQFAGPGRGSLSGRMVAANAVGSVVGAMLTAFVLLPIVGSEASILLFALLYTMSGVVICIRESDKRARVVSLVIGLGAIVLIANSPQWDQLALTSGENVYFRPAFVTHQSKLRFFYEDAAGGITTVVENPAPVGFPRSYVLLTNGKFQGSSLGESRAQVAFALIPALHSRQLSDCLVIGLGTGQSACVVDALGFDRIDIAEIAPGIVEAARTYFVPINGGVVDSSRVKIHLEDGRNTLLLREEKYDLVTMEISSIWFANATNLYSREFYQLARSRLRPHGVFQQWIQLHHIGTEELVSAILTVRSVFPYVSFWVVGGQGIVVASDYPQRIELAPLRAVMRSDSRSLRWLRGDLPRELVRLMRDRVLAPADVDRIQKLVKVRLNTDRNRKLEYETPRFNLSHEPWFEINVVRLRRMSEPSKIPIAPEALRYVDAIAADAISPP